MKEGAVVLMMRVATTAVGVFLTVVIGTAQESSAPEESVQRGKALVVQNCSACHAVGLTGDSPHPTAPPFRRLSERFPIDALEETFIDSIDTGHPGMPVFEASQQQINDIIDYIASVME